MKKILFLHGLESQPGGTKPTHLYEAGHIVLNPALPKESFAESVKIAQHAIDLHRPDFVIGSSRGGAVAMAVDARGAKLVLIAPAWKRFGVEPSVTDGTKILHSEHDTIVPISDSVELTVLSKSALYRCGTCHRMSGTEALTTMLDTVKDKE